MVNVYVLDPNGSEVESAGPEDEIILFRASKPESLIEVSDFPHYLALEHEAESAEGE